MFFYETERKWIGKIQETISALHYFQLLGMGKQSSARNIIKEVDIYIQIVCLGFFF